MMLRIICPTHIPAKILGVAFGVDPHCWGLQREDCLCQLATKLFSKYFNPCDHDTSTSRTCYVSFALQHLYSIIDLESLTIA